MVVRRFAPLLLCLAPALGCTDEDRARPPDMAVLDAASDQGVAGPATKCAPVGLPRILSNLPGSHTQPRMAFTGQGFVVAWSTALSTMSGTQHRAVAQVTDVSGNKLGPNLPMSVDPIADGSPPSVSPLKSGTVIAWTRQSGVATDLVVSTLDPSGQKMDGSAQPCDPGATDCGIFPITSSGNARFPSLARPQLDQHTAQPLDDQIGVAWIDARNYPCGAAPCIVQNDVYWKKILPNGTELIPDKRLTTLPGRRQALPRLAFDGANGGLVWRDDTLNTSFDFHFMTLDGLGQVGVPPTQVGSASGTLATGSPDLVWSGEDYALVTASGSSATASVLLQRFKSNGQPALAPRGVTFGGVACNPSIAWDGTYYALAWQTKCDSPGSDIAFQLLDPQGTRMKPDGTSCGSSLDPSCGVLTLSSAGSGSASHPDLVWTGGHSFGLVWTQSGSSNADAGVSANEILFSRVDCVSP